MSSDRCSQAMNGWLAGCGAVTLFFYAFGLIVLVLSPGGVSIMGFLLGIVSLATVGLLVFMVTMMLTGIPAVGVIWLSEQLRIRSVLFFGGSGAVIGTVIQNLLSRTVAPFSATISWPFAIVGLAAGVAYWRVAGRCAGGDTAR